VLRVSPGLNAVLSTVVSVGVGALTNLATDNWSWSVGIGLAFLAGIAALLTWTNTRTAPIRRARIRQVATSGSEISGGHISATEGAKVTEAAHDHGRIEGSSIEARGAEVEREARQATIRNNDIHGG